MRSVFRSYCNNKNWKLAFQILDKMILPLGMRIKKYSRETGSFTPPYSRWGWEQKYDLFQEFECPTDMSSPTSLATFQGQVLKLREQEGAFEGTWGGALSSLLCAVGPCDACARCVQRIQACQGARAGQLSFRESSFHFPIPAYLPLSLPVFGLFLRQ